MPYHVAKTIRLGNRQSNEDRIAVCERKNTLLLALADGMGGHAGGDLAAEALINSVVHDFNHAALPITDSRVFLEELISIGHQQVIHTGNEHDPPLQARTTCVLCLIQDATAHWAHIGDSRLYHFRHGQLLTRTTDHSQVEDLVKWGVITSEQKRSHPMRNMITQCVGSRTQPPQPSYSEVVQLQRGDEIVLCSDGLWGPLPSDKIANYLVNTNLRNAVEEMAYEAEKCAYPYSDNISLIVLRWIGGGKLRHRANDNVMSGYDDMLDDLDKINDAIGKLDDKF